MMSTTTCMLIEVWIPQNAIPYINLFLLVVLFILALFSIIKRTVLRIGQSANYLHTQAQLKSMKFAPNSYIAVTKDHNIIMWNPASETSFGYKAIDMRGKSIDIVMDEENKKLFDAAMILDNGIPIELEIIHKNRNRIPVETTVWKWKDENGIGEYYTAISKDISHRKGTDKTKEHLYATVNELKLLYLEAEKADCTGVCLWDMVNNQVIVATQGFSEIMDVNDKQFTITQVLRRIHVQDKPNVLKHLRDIEESRKNCNFEFRVLGKDAQINTIHCKLKCYLGEDLQVKNVMWTIRVIKQESYASNPPGFNSD